MSLNLQNINHSLYFEFYLNDNFFYRYNYNPEELELNLFDLCRQIGKEVLKFYKYKKFTGSNYSFQTSLWFSVLVSCTPENIDINQTEGISADYPLDVRLDEKEFSINLYMNLLNLLCNYFDTDSYCEELERWRRTLQRNSKNIFWNSFPSYGSLFFNQVQNISNEIEKTLQCLNSSGSKNAHDIEAIINKSIVDIDTIQSYSHNVLNCYDTISEYYHKCICFSKHSKSNISLDNVKVLLQIQKNRNQIYLNYIQGDFNIISDECFLEVNKMMALKLFMFQINHPVQQYNYPDYLQKKMINMVDQKNSIIEGLYNLQAMAIYKLSLNVSLS